MNEPIIEIRNLGKKYNIFRKRENYLALRDAVAQLFASPIKTIQAIFGRQDFWALREVSFDVAKGDVIGIIGANGAGKSTLLKILSKITPPTEGEIIIRGKISSLLEVGTGFHPELTGRENVYLNGAILGMSRSEIQGKFNDIVEFAGVEMFLDTPVKRYSSGMQVRLAFSIAAHLEPDILIVDEVLAVGDAEFQKKCLGRMEEVTSKDGRTILFVSHNMAAVRRICNKCVLLEDGRIKNIGDTEGIIQEYLSSFDGMQSTENPRLRPPESVCEIAGPKINQVFLTDRAGNHKKVFGADEIVRLGLEIIPDDGLTKNFAAVWFLSNVNGQHVAVGASSPIDTVTYPPETTAISCDIKPQSLLPGKYRLRVLLHVPGEPNLDDWEDAIAFEILRNDEHESGHNYPGIWTSVQQYVSHKFH